MYHKYIFFTVRFGDQGSKDASPVNIGNFLTVGRATYKFLSGVVHHGKVMAKGHYTSIAICPDGSFSEFDDCAVRY